MSTLTKTFITLAIVLVSGFIAQSVSAQDVQEYPQTSTSLISRVGSLRLVPSAAAITSDFLNSAFL